MKEHLQSLCKWEPALNKSLNIIRSEVNFYKKKKYRPVKYLLMRGYNVFLIAKQILMNVYRSPRNSEERKDDSLLYLGTIDQSLKI